MASAQIEEELKINFKTFTEVSLEVQLVCRDHLPVSRPPALAVARFETVMYARLECVGTRSIRNSGWREEGKR